jgi:hypothetical protein
MRLTAETAPPGLAELATASWYLLNPFFMPS